MIQFNLLPDIKIQYLRANRQKHLVVLGSMVAITASLICLAILLSLVFGLQKKSISDLSKDIKKSAAQLQGTKDLTKILTVQNQLKSLTSLHDAKPVVSRLFAFLQASTPPAASNSRVLGDFVAHTMTMSGAADSLGTVNTYIDALKATTYETADQAGSAKQAFTDVVLASFGRDTKSATYTITLNFDPAIFSETADVTFHIGAVPKNEAGQ